MAIIKLFDWKRYSRSVSVKIDDKEDVNTRERAALDSFIKTSFDVALAKYEYDASLNLDFMPMDSVTTPERRSLAVVL